MKILAIKKNIFLLTFLVCCSCHLFGQQIQKLDALPETIVDLELSNEKYTILEIWASWCLPCIESIQKIDTLENRYAKDIEFVLINSYDTESKSNEILDKFNLTSRKIMDADQQIIDFFKIDMVGNILILNKDKTKYWIGAASILNKKDLDTLIFDNLLPNFVLDEEFQKLTTAKYTIEFSLGNPAQKRNLAYDENYLKLTNTPLKSILEIHDNKLEIKDNSLLPLYLNLEKTAISASESMNQEITRDLLNLFNAQKSDNQILLNTDFLIKYDSF